KKKYENITKSIEEFELKIQQLENESKAYLTTILYKHQHHENQQPLTDPTKFVKSIELYDLSLCEFFDALYQSANPQSKNKFTQEKLKKKLSICVIIEHH
ncbi:20478_t:CDS:2, partial [Racocetra persica]